MDSHQIGYQLKLVYPRDPFLGTLFFLVYIHDLLNCLQMTHPIFSVVNDSNISVNELNKDL